VASVRKISTKSAGTVWQARWRERGPDGHDRSCAKNFSSHRAARDYANIKEQTIERRGIGGARELGDIPLTKLTTAHVDNALSALLRQGGRSQRDPKQSRPLARSTVRRVHRILSVALGRAVKRHLIPGNPAADATPPETSSSSGPKGFSAQEVKALLDVAETKGPETLTLTALLLVTGLRRSEVLGVSFEDVDFEAGTLTVRRTVLEIAHQPVEREGGKSAAALRTISIPPALVAMLQAQKTRILEQALAWGPSYSRSPLYCLPGPDGKAMAPEYLSRRMRQLMQAAGISGRSPVHRWRHTSGSVLYDLTRNVKTVQQRLGHSSYHTTMSIYVHAAAERDREASEHFERILTTRNGKP